MSTNTINFKELWESYWKEYRPSHPTLPRRTYEGYVYDVAISMGYDKTNATIAADKAWEHYEGVTRYNAFHDTGEEYYSMEETK